MEGSNLANEVVSALWNIFAKIGPFIALFGVILLFTPLLVSVELG